MDYLSCVPSDILKCVIIYLDIESLSSFTLTCKRIRDEFKEVYDSYYQRCRQILLVILSYSKGIGLERSDLIVHDPYAKIGEIFSPFKDKWEGYKCLISDLYKDRGIASANENTIKEYATILTVGVLSESVGNISLYSRDKRQLRVVRCLPNIYLVRNNIPVCIGKSLKEYILSQVGSNIEVDWLSRFEGIDILSTRELVTLLITGHVSIDYFFIMNEPLIRLKTSGETVFKVRMGNIESVRVMIRDGSLKESTIKTSLGTSICNDPEWGRMLHLLNKVIRKTV